MPNQSDQPKTEGFRSCLRFQMAFSERATSQEKKVDRLIK